MSQYAAMPHRVYLRAPSMAKRRYRGNRALLIRGSLVRTQLGEPNRRFTGWAGPKLAHYFGHQGNTTRRNTHRSAMAPTRTSAPQKPSPRAHPKAGAALWALWASCAVAVAACVSVVAMACVARVATAGARWSTVTVRLTRTRDGSRLSVRVWPRGSGIGLPNRLGGFDSRDPLSHSSTVVVIVSGPISTRCVTVWVAMASVSSLAIALACASADELVLHAASRRARRVA